MKKWITSLILITTITVVVCAASGLNPILDCYAECNSKQQWNNAKCSANGEGQDCYDAASTGYTECIEGCNGGE
jgi:hypothetical protein